MRRIVVFLLLGAACGSPARPVAAVASGGAAAASASPGPAPSAPSTTRELIGSRRLAVPCLGDGDELTRPTGRETVVIPDVIGHPGLARAVAAWVREEFPDADARQDTPARSPTEPSVSEPFVCGRRVGPGGVTVNELRGLVSLSFTLPLRFSQKFGFSPQAVFAIEGGSRVRELIDPDRRDALYAKIIPRYKAALERSLVIRKNELGTAEDCTDVLDGYGPNLDDFDIHAGHITFNTWNSIPMYAKACFPSDDSTEFTWEELAPFLNSTLELSP